MLHATQAAASYANLDTARHDATKKQKYNSEQTRCELRRLFSERFGGKDPYEWQLDVTEALLLGLDCVVIAGTGAGKTMPFMMPLLLHKEKTILIISPLKVLQADQAERFEKMGISAAAVNGDTWNAELQRKLQHNELQGVLTSPEMCLEHEGFRKVVTDTTFSDHICAVVIDEAHCISQWGGDFRKEYSNLQKLRALFPTTIPFLATSATLTPQALDDVRSSLLIDEEDSFFLNRGNDRPNIAYSTRSIKSSTDYDALRPYLGHNDVPTSPSELVKTIIFTNSIAATQLITRTIRSWFPPHIHKYIDFLHARRSPQAKRRVMRRYRKKSIKILIATEAAGMGADIPDIEQVIQFGVPSSLSVWIQRAGRAGRSFDIHARAILFYEESMFQRKRRRKKKTQSTPQESDNEMEEDVHEEVADGEDGDEDEAENEDEGEVTDNEEIDIDLNKGVDHTEGGNGQMDMDNKDGKEWGKKVDNELRKWIATQGCRRDVTDKYFNNPPDRKEPLGHCCDRCDPIIASTITGLGVNEERSCTPDLSASPIHSAHSTPSKSANIQGKRPMITAEDYVPSKRRGDHLKSARHALQTWRFLMKREHYTPSPFTANAILPDDIIKTLSSNGVASLNDMRALLRSSGWLFLDRHGEAILSTLRKVDSDVFHNREAAKRQKADAVAARQLEQQREKEHKRMEKERKQRETQLRKEKEAAERAERRRLKAEASAAKKASRLATRQANRTPRGRVLAGSSVFNINATSNTELEPSSSPFTVSQQIFLAHDMSPTASHNITPAPPPRSKRQPHLCPPTTPSELPFPRPLPRPLPRLRLLPPKPPSSEIGT